MGNSAVRSNIRHSDIDLQHRSLYSEEYWNWFHLESRHPSSGLEILGGVFRGLLEATVVQTKHPHALLCVEPYGAYLGTTERISRRNPVSNAASPVD